MVKKHLSKQFYLKIYVAWPLCMQILSLYYSDLDINNYKFSTTKKRNQTQAI